VLAAEPAFDCGTGACVRTEQQLSRKCEYVLHRPYPWRPRNTAHRAIKVVRKIVHSSGSSATTTAWVAQQARSLLVDVGDRIGRSIKQPPAGRHSSTLRRDNPAAATRPTQRPHTRVCAGRMT
jgi:hypothetical protein